MKKKLTALLLVVMAFAGSFLYVAPAEAIQPLCWSCIYIWFNGFFCDANSGPAADCNDSGPGCIELGECNALTAITD